MWIKNTLYWIEELKELEIGKLLWVFISFITKPNAYYISLRIYM